MSPNTNTDSREIQAQELGEEIMSMSCAQLLVNFRFLDRALGNIKYKVNSEATFCSDGRYIYYNPWFVLNLYQSDQKVVTRNLMHSLLHCIMRHNVVGPGIDRYAWDLACDIAVENIINELHKDFLESTRQKTQRLLIDTLKDKQAVLSAERIYRILIDEEHTFQELQSARLPFVGDDHSIWYGIGENARASDMDIDLEELWEKISRRMQTELEVVMGEENALTQNLRDINRARYDYTEFLRRFGVHGEIMRLSEDEFDYNYYSYGIELYGNIPLIEPLEYQDQNKIRDFVIAIDTSGSVRGEVVQKFIQHTHDILSAQENFYTKVNMYIIQCDDRIRDVKYISTREDFDEYLTTMEIKGLGETDFRPVFAYVDELVGTGKLKELRGLLYFTDGKGQFPSDKPDYDVAFIIHDDGFSRIWTPDWAMKLYLADDDILDERFSGKR